MRRQTPHSAAGLAVSTADRSIGNRSFWFLHREFFAGRLTLDQGGNRYKSMCIVGCFSAEDAVINGTIFGHAWKRLGQARLKSGWISALAFLGAVRPRRIVPG